MIVSSFQVVPYDSDIYHHGILGQKWGVRRYQNSDGTLTLAGKERYYKSNPGQKKRRIGITEKGKIGFVTDKPSKEAVALFAAKTTLLVGSMAASVYVAKHPEIIQKGANFIKKNSSKTIEEISSATEIYSKSLGRMLTLEEIDRLGL